MNAIINAAQRRLSTLFPEFFNGNTKHDYAKDYGWPDNITFDFLYRVYTRNGLAAAAADRLSLRTWQTLPEFWESNKPVESGYESDLRKRFEDIRGWSALIETDLRAFVGGYSGAILRLADNKNFSEPVDRVNGGVDGIVEIVPAWASQLTVTQWDDNEQSENYGRPLMFQFNESALRDTNTGANSTNQKMRQFNVHPDRVLLWSADGTIYARSNLHAGYNSLIDVEKIVGAGGEGFWKNAKSAPVISVEDKFDVQTMAQSLGVTPDLIKDAMSERVSDWQQGFDKLLMLQGMKAEALAVTLPQPNEFFMIAANMFAASVSIPVRVLIGNQTGERASTEDQIDFNKTCMSRRERVVIPMLRDLLNRFEKWGIIAQKDWIIHWDSLLDSSPSDKMTRAQGMATINNTMLGAMGDGEPAFSVDEIRAELNMDPREQIGATNG